MKETRNDFDTVAERIDGALASLLGNAHEPPRNNSSDSLTITKDGYLTSVIRLQRLRNWVAGLADGYRNHEDDSETT